MEVAPSPGSNCYVYVIRPFRFIGLSAKNGRGLGKLSFTFQRNSSVKGGGVPPFSAKEKNLLFFSLIFR